MKRMFNYIGDDSKKKIKLIMQYNLCSFNWIQLITLITCIIAPKIMKYLGMYLKPVQDLCAENYTIERRNQRRYL